jgi:hypothetical protein
MTAIQSTQRHGATLWRAACRAAAALRAVHDEQVLMWELVWRSSRVPVDRAGPLAWTPSLDGPRLTGRHLPSPAASPAFPCCSRSFPETHYAVPETPHGS